MGVGMLTGMRWILGVLVALVALGLPLAYYRTVYENYRRFREVEPNKFYRSGQLTALGFSQMVKQYNIKTVINLQEENNDPYMPVVWSGPSKTQESELCRANGIQYYALVGSELVTDAELIAGKRPVVIDHFLKILDDPKSYPILLHCKAGLHRTGLLTAIYRMEFQNRSKMDAMQELRANGFGTFAACLSNDYLVQFIELYKPKVRNPVSDPKPGGVAAVNPAGEGAPRK